LSKGREDGFNSGDTLEKGGGRKEGGKKRRGTNL